jgi:MATE family multidrug resistance protein
MLFVVGSTDWEAQARRAQELTSGTEGEVEKPAAHTSATAAGEGGRPEKGEQEGVERSCYDHEPLISNRDSGEAEAETV